MGQVHCNLFICLHLDELPFFSVYHNKMSVNDTNVVPDDPENLERLLEDFNNTDPGR